MKKLIVFLSMFIFAIPLFNQTTKVEAAGDKSYSIQSVLPDNQIDKNESYFDLKVEPNKDQTLKIIIFNTGSKSIKVTAEVNNAYTADSATIGYDKYNKKTYKSTLPELTSLVEGARRKSVSLKAGESKEVSFNVKSPDKEYKGIILGGVTTIANVSPTKSKNLNIQNQVRYVKGVVLRSKDDAINPDMHLTDAYPKAVSGSKGIAFKMDNTAPININNVKLAASIKHNSKNLKYHAKNLQIAPNSQFDYFIPIDNFTAGKYKAKITLTGKNGFKQVFTKTITVSKTDVKQVQQQTEPVKQNNHQWIIILVGIVLLIFVALWMYLYYAQRNKSNSKHGKSDRRRK
ncbi:DUF916 and DUF3324 domain-containing protein [Companilactobacillus kedongensis]|uniref:DUF916 and DUF3324 domain-containing protein n=1 Tax=Companilactobacillus kedongensis TaxID=2486004 RepID=UPI000F7A5CE2|nr:DUF916 and DUF3324 domain-containing protein [Companilactobacillus kedongensis]